MSRVYDYIIESPRITSGYGNRIHPITKKKAFHYGVDIVSNKGNRNLFAIEDGYVQKVVTGQDKATTGYGNYIWVRYPRINKSLMYAHCKEIKLKKGDKVKKGTVVAIEGKTGAATGVHVHLGMTAIGSDKWLNPQDYDYEPPKEETKTEIKEETSPDYKEAYNTLNENYKKLVEEKVNYESLIDKYKTELIEKDKELANLNSQIEELNTELVNCKEQAENLKFEPKFTYKAIKTGTYKIKLTNNETLYVV